MKLKAKAFLEAMQEAMQGMSAQGGNTRVQEARQGNIIRVADLEYLQNPRQHPSMFVSPGVSESAKELEAVFLSESGFDVEDIMELANTHYVEMGEANSASAFGQLMRVGVQTIANDFYLRTEVSWMDYVQETASSARQEFYAPLYGSSLPQLTRPQQPYKESPIVGEDSELINQKFMGGESFERELWEDDQTGQIKQRAANLGDAQRQLEEIYVAGRILGATNFTVANFVVPASNYQTRNASGTLITTPYSANLYRTGQGNVLSTNKVLNGSSLKEGVAKLMNAIDPKGIKILGRPNHLVVSTADALNAPMLLESNNNPTVQGVGGTTFNNQMGGNIGGILAKNVFKGMFTFSVNYFFPDWAWVVGQKKKGPMFQRRSPMEIVQEVPNSGQSFDLDSIRYRSRARWEMDFVGGGSRFWLRGNDGTAQGQQ